MISPEEIIEETSAIHKIHTPCSSRSAGLERHEWPNDDEHSISDADESDDELKQESTKKKSNVHQTYQISLQTMDTTTTNNNNNNSNDQPMIDDIRPNSSSYEHTMLKFTSINKLSVDGESNASDDNFSISDYESNSASPRMMNNSQPIKYVFIISCMIL